MNKQNSNNLFNKDELLKLLNEKQSGDSNALSDLDDFDKEALQGFESLDDTTQATHLLNDIDKEISVRVGDDSVRKRNPYIWIGAAASVALIILISVIVVKQSHKDLASTNLSLNEPENNFDKTIVAESLPDATISDATIVLDDKITKSKKISQSTVTIIALNQKSANELATTGVSSSTDFEKKENENNADGLASDADVKTLSGISSNDIALAEQVVVTSVINETKPMATSMPAINKEVDVSNIAFNDSKNKYNKKNTTEVNEEKIALEKSDKGKTKSEAVITGSDNGLSISRDASLNNETAAYYFGGNVKLKQDVINYNAAKNDNILQLIGTYKIGITVYDTGLIKVNTIKTISGNCKDCVNVISKALFSFKIWKPAVFKGKNITSDLEFTLSF